MTVDEIKIELRRLYQERAEINKRVGELQDMLALQDPEYRKLAERWNEN